MDTDNREALKSMLRNMIDNKHEEATLDLNKYTSAKIREIAGITPEMMAAVNSSPNLEISDEDDDGDETVETPEE
jgi:hypothetical protein